MHKLMKRYIEYLQMQNYSPNTYKNREVMLEAFIAWLDERGIDRLNDVTKPILERYRRFLYHSLNDHGKPMSVHGQHTRLVSVRQFFKWLSRHNYILYNPASEIELPKIPQHLPKHPLTTEEAEAVLSIPNVSQPMGLRDRAIIEVFYSTGIRRMEMVNLSRYDINHTHGILSVRQGKGQKDRFVPIGERALYWVERYVNEIRPLHVMEPDPQNLFLNDDGTRVSKDQLSRRMSNYVKRAGVNKTGACHLFRHTMATVMLEHGADIRFIQHSDLTTTEMYTKVAIHHLKKVHNNTHPAKLHPSQSRSSEADALLSALLEEGEDG